MNGYFLIENLGDTNNPEEMARYRFLAGSRAVGLTMLVPGPVPGNGDRWQFRLSRISLSEIMAKEANEPNPAPSPSPTEKSVVDKIWDRLIGADKADALRGHRD